MAPGGRFFVALGALLAVVAGAGVAYVVGPKLAGEPEPFVKHPPTELRLDRSDRAFPLAGVIEVNGTPLAGATIAAGTQTATTDETGTFSFESVSLGTVTVTRPGYLPAEIDVDGTVEEIDVTMEPRVVRGLFVSFAKLASDSQFEDLIHLADTTTVNSFVFEVKGDWDGGYVYYDTQVQAAKDANAVRVKYDIDERLTETHDAGLYAIARVPAFISSAYTAKFPDHAILGQYLDPGNRDAWEYPLALAVETCEMGFDEIQFDYVRYPESYPRALAPNQDARVANIKAFLQEAADRLHPLGCALSADTFGIVNVEKNDQGIGQLLEEVAIPLDVDSPMLYPSQWSDIGSLIGVSNPAANPHDTIAAILDIMLPRVPDTVIVRPFLQAYSYSATSILAEIRACEERGLGWLLWNVAGNYDAAALPVGTTGDG
jgi:hypothetical protein